MSRKRRRQPSTIKHNVLEQLNLNAAGIDLGVGEIYVCVPAERDEQPVRCFGTFTDELEAIADWLAACEIETVAMESTGVDWVPLYDILEQRGYEVYLVNARHLKNVSGRKVTLRIANGCNNCIRTDYYRLPFDPLLRSGPSGR